MFGYGDTPARVVVILLAIGFPLFLIFSWIFEITPQGIRRGSEVPRDESITHHTGQRINRLIVIVAGLAVLVWIATRLLT